MRFRNALTAPWITLLACIPAGTAAAAPESGALEHRIEALIRQNEQMQQEIDDLKNEVRAARDEARAARSRAEATTRSLPDVSQGGSFGSSPSDRDGAILSRQVGRANFQVIDISLNVLSSLGWSSAGNGDLELLQGGDHDPRRRGFNLQQVELGFSGAVDPFFTADAFIVYWIDPEGESRFEIEEAFATTQMLPFGLEEQGLQVELGHFFTEYGRLNPVHPHAWDWQDQPIVNTRFFGEDGLRNPGFRIGWLTPLPWFSEVHLGAQSAQGETAASFFSSDEVFEERPIGGRPFDSPGTRDPGDLLYLARWVNAIDMGYEWSAQWGVSGLFGPNATGGGGRTYVAGTDLVVKWLPLDANRGWPSLSWTAEFSYRWYDADSFTGCPEDPDCGERLPGDLLRDWGLVTQLVWGFERGWDLGVRYEYLSGSGDNVEFDDGLGGWVEVSRNTDPFRDDRHRVSPLLSFYPSEFSRLRLQYNYDRVRFRDERDVHTGWFGVEFLFGAHSAHSY